MKIKVLTKKELEKKLKDIPEWKVNTKGTELSRVFVVPTFISGLALAAKITVHAEIAEHHPTIELSYGKVAVSLTTHDAKGLTKKDIDLARKIDGIKVRQ